MKKTAVHNALRRASALALAVLLAIPTVYAAAGEEKLQTSSTLVEGLTYRNTVTVNNASRVESFSLELEEGSEAYPILLQSSGTVYGAATIKKAISRAQELGYHVLGAVNTDFFSTATGVPLGIVIEDGVYKAGPADEAAMLITEGRVTLCEQPVVNLTLTNERDGSVVTPNLNRWRSTAGGLYLLNSDFSSVSTRTSTPGWFARMKVVPENGEEELPRLTVNSSLSLEVVEVIHSDQALAIGADEYILTADDAGGYDALFQSFQVGDRITLTTSCEDEALSAAQWAGGVGDVMIRDGRITDSAQWTYASDGRNPRTALGVKADGTLVVYAVDGRKSGYSAGLSQKDLAEELLDRGCQWAVNLDGGGSTAISVWVPGQSGPDIRNIPSEGTARSCATYLLLVTDEAGDGSADRLALTEDGLTVLTGSSVVLPQAVALDSALNIVDSNPGGLTVTSGEALGDVEDGIYTAGRWAGTDTLLLRSRELGVRGTAQIHVVDALTSLTISKQGSTAALASLTVRPGESVQLAVTGSYWNRTALRDWAPVSWTVTGDIGSVDGNGLFTASGTGESGSITATAGGLSQTIQISMANMHTDVPEGHWAYEAVEYCYEHGIVGGISPTEFGPAGQISRGDFMLMLYGAAGRPDVTAACSFTDVSPSDYYYTAIAWGQSMGLASGTGDGAFSPKAPITREQAFTILHLAMPLLGKECPTGSLTVLEQFSDREQISDYAKGHTATLVSQGLVSGSGGCINPRSNLSRVEMAVLLYGVLTFTPTRDDPSTPTAPAQPEQPGSADYALSLSESEVTLKSGESCVLTAVLEPELAGAEITWTSSDPSAAAVTSKGVVTNLYPGTGTAAVTITASWNGKSANCVVYCAQADLTGMVVNAENGLNVRSGPGTENAVIGGLDNGARLVILSVENGWCHVLYLSRAGQAAIGYVSSAYIQLTR